LGAEDNQDRGKIQRLYNKDAEKRIYIYISNVYRTSFKTWFFRQLSDNNFLYRGFMFGKGILVLSVFCSGFCASLEAVANPISLGSPVQITTSEVVQSSVVVCGTNSGYMAGCTDDNGDMLQSFSSNGTSWDTPFIVYTESSSDTWVSGTEAGFMSVFFLTPPLVQTGFPASRFSSDNGTSWTSDQVIELTDSAFNPITVSGTTAGFMTAWHDSHDTHPYASFSDDNGQTWTTSELDSVGSVASFAVGVCGTAAGFMTTWQGAGNNAYASFTSNNGNIWSSPSAITTSADVYSDVFVGGNSSGFMAVWVTDTNTARSIFSADNGTTWTSPLTIATGLKASTDIFVTGSIGGFVVAWIGNDNNAYGSFSSDHGVTWSTPVQITTDGSVSSSNTQGAKALVSITTVNDACVFAWRDTGNHAMSIYGFINEIQPPTNLSGSQKKNVFCAQYELYNMLRWSPSPFVGVAGYNVYANGEKVAVLNASTFVYEAHNQRKKVVTSYAVTAFDSNGNESIPVTITVP